MILYLLILLRAVGLEMAVGITLERYSYDTFNGFDENVEFEHSSHNIIRKSTRDTEPTNRSGIETEPRPPFPFLRGTHGATRSIQPSTRLPSIPLNTTLSPSNKTINVIVNDRHKYYASSYDGSGADKWWYGFKESEYPTIVHEGLSKDRQYSDTIRTSFQFPFYGHVINYVTITNKGYVFLGDVVHKFNASSQYVAPLMADFKTNNDTMIAYVDTGHQFTIQWASLTFQDRKVGEFSFQLTLLKNGTFIFAYRNIPAPVVELRSDSFQQRVGLSDSLRYRILRYGLFFISGKYSEEFLTLRPKGPVTLAIFAAILDTTLAHNYYFKYHSVDLPMESVKSGAAYVITPLPNCILFKSCNACVSTQTEFKCVWCPRLQRCSDGVDRYRQEWFVYGCQRNNQTKCSIEPPTLSVNTTTTTPVDTASQISTSVNNTEEKMKSTPRMQTSSPGTERLSVMTTLKYKTAPKMTTKEALIIETAVTSSDVVTTAAQKPSSRPSERNQSNGQNSGRVNIGGDTGALAGHSRGSAVSGVGIGLIVFSLIIISAALFWFIYAYRHPRSRSGRFLIEHRNPKKWFKTSQGTSTPRMHFTAKSMELSES